MEHSQVRHEPRAARRGRMPLQADLEAGLLPPVVPILDSDLLDDDLDTDGVGDFMRGLERDGFDEY